MSPLIPAGLIPLNIFQIFGTACCATIQTEFLRGQFSQHFWCFDAHTIADANVFVIWGSLSKQFLTTVQSHIPLMPKTNHILHIRGCQERLHNQKTSSSLSNALPINAIFSNCHITAQDYKKMIKEARACLKT